MLSASLNKIRIHFAFCTSLISYFFLSIITFTYSAPFVFTRAQHLIMFHKNWDSFSKDSLWNSGEYETAYFTLLKWKIFFFFVWKNVARCRSFLVLVRGAKCGSVPLEKLKKHFLIMCVRSNLSRIVRRNMTRKLRQLCIQTYQ